MACKVACIVTDIPGAKELVVDGETGLIIQPNSPEAIAESIRYLASDREKAIAFGLAGYERIRTVYTMEKIRGKPEKGISFSHSFLTPFHRATGPAGDLSVQQYPANRSKKLLKHSIAGPTGTTAGIRTEIKRKTEHQTDIFPLDMRIRLVARQLKILILKIKISFTSGLISILGKARGVRESCNFTCST